MEFIENGIELKDADYVEFCDFLAKNGNIKKAEFDEKIIKTAMKIYGFTAKQIAELSKYLLSCENKVLDYPSDKIYEITLLQGLIIVKNKNTALSEKITAIKSWAKNIDNWSHADCVMSKIYCAENDRKELFSFALRQSKEKNEFEARCGIIILFSFMSDEYMADIFKLFDEIEYGRYYVDMAVAWFVATALTSYKNKTLLFLDNSEKINDFTYIKSLQKARESYRIPKEDKAYYKTLIFEKRKKK